MRQQQQDLLNLFRFRQRAGALDWGSIQDIDIDEVIEHGQIGVLQAQLDNLVFSEINNNDMKKCNSSVKLMRCMQLICEYMLFAQEQQSTLTSKLCYKLSAAKRKINTLETKNLTYREDLKVYQNELALVRKVHHLNINNGSTVSPALQNSTENVEVQVKTKEMNVEYNVKDVKDDVHVRDDQAGGEVVKNIQDDKLNHHEIDLRLMIARLFEQQRELIEQQIVTKENKILENENIEEDAILELGQKVNTIQSTLESVLNFIRKKGKDKNVETLSNNENIPTSTTDISDLSPFRKKSRGSTNNHNNMSSSISYEDSLNYSSNLDVAAPISENISTGISSMLNQASEDIYQREKNEEIYKRELDVSKREREIEEKEVLLHEMEISLSEIHQQNINKHDITASTINQATLIGSVAERVRSLEEKVKETTHTKIETKSFSTSTTNLEDIKEKERNENEKAKKLKDEHGKIIQKQKMETVRRDRELGAKIVKARLAQAQWKSKLRSMRKWMTLTADKREQEQFQAELLANEKVKELEAARLLAEIEAKNKEEELEMRLKIERDELLAKDKSIQAKLAEEREVEKQRYYALVDKNEKEKAALKEASALEAKEQMKQKVELELERQIIINEKQEKIAKAAMKMDTAVMTSIDFDSSNSKVGNELEDIENDDDDELWLSAQQRIESKVKESLNDSETEERLRREIENQINN